MDQSHLLNILQSLKGGDLSSMLSGMSPQNAGDAADMIVKAVGVLVKAGLDQEELVREIQSRLTSLPKAAPQQPQASYSGRKPAWRRR